VISAAQIGNTLRVLTAENGDAATRMADVLRAANIVATVEPSEPNLEDVFVAATRGREEEAA
jgi:ABC-2 type transport system ATP-binding protein